MNGPGYIGAQRLVLVVDDHGDFCVAMEHLLHALGYRVICASDGIEALKQLKNELPSLILTDLFMPNMDGLELIRRLRKLKPELPVIAVTGDIHVAAESVGYTAASLGARAVLMKPFSKEQLASAIGFACTPTNRTDIQQPA